jgi:hypothetical protein
MDFLKTIGGKIVGGIVALAVVTAGIALFRMDPAARNAAMGSVGHGLGVFGRVLGWLALVGVIPWATFFLSTWVARFERNAAGAALVVVYTAGEGALLAWLFDWGVQGATAWIFFAAAVLVALLYNVLICDWIAERWGGE